MKYYLIAGEASGDLHGSNLMKALKSKDPAADFRFWGGDLMQAQGGALIKHYRDLAFMGFVEVVKNLKTILNNIKFCKEDIQAYQPDAIILIDYPGFNLRIAKWAKQQGFKIFYYISPQVWAWKAKRVKGIKASVDQLYTILPFEADFYKKYDYEVTFVGHPLLDVIEDYEVSDQFFVRNNLDKKPIIALLPGSRKQEIRRMLPEMLSVIKEFPNYQFVIGAAPSMPINFYTELINSDELKQIAIVQGQTYDLMQLAKAALVTSGTATLETALFNTPEVVCYKGNQLSYLIAKRLIKVKYISLVNLIVDAPIVTELIQKELNYVRIKEELQSLLAGEKAKQLQEDYKLLREKLGQAGASKRTAEHIYQLLHSQKSS